MTIRDFDEEKIKARMQKEQRLISPFAVIFDDNYIGEIKGKGDVVTYTLNNRIVKDYVEGISEEPRGDKIKLTVDKAKYFNTVLDKSEVIIDNINEYCVDVENKDILACMEENCAHKIEIPTLRAEDIKCKIKAVHDMIVRANCKAKGQMSGVVTAGICGVLELADMAFNNQRQLISNAYIGTVADVDLYLLQEIYDIDGCEGCYIFPNSSMKHARAVTNAEIYVPELRFEDYMKGLLFYGTAIINNDEIVKIKVRSNKIII